MRRREHDVEFECFVIDVWDRLLHAATLLTRNRADAEDLTQTVLVRTYAAWSRVRREDAYAYARRAMMNGYIDGWRRRRTAERAALPLSAERVAETDAVEDREQIQVLMAGLSRRERSILVLRYYFDLPEADVARTLDVSVGTVKSTSSRALAKLRVLAADAASAPRGA